eukprot:336593-Hanusia_phi.AAC.1
MCRRTCGERCGERRGGPSSRHRSGQADMRVVCPARPRASWQPGSQAADRVGRDRTRGEWQPA